MVYRKDGASSLFIASQEGKEGCVRALLEAGAEVDQVIMAIFPQSHKKNQIIAFSRPALTMPLPCSRPATRDT